jgi:glycerol transport system ATP-binding protein
VFQFPVIYDTMTVFDNLAFPLRNRGIAAAEVRSRVSEVAEMLELTDDLRRRASGLAADEKQKVSLGRGLVRSDVSAILFDEPLTVVDPDLKWRLRRKLKEIHKRYSVTLIYVTHDQGEALTFADRVVVMDEGSVLQEGTPQELFETPTHRFVGLFHRQPGNELSALPVVTGRRRGGGSVRPASDRTADKGSAGHGVGDRNTAESDRS